MSRSTAGFEDDRGTTPNQPSARDGCLSAFVLALAYLFRFWVAVLDHDDHSLIAWLSPYMAPALFVFVAVYLYRRDEPNRNGTTVGGMTLCGGMLALWMELTGTGFGPKFELSSAPVNGIASIVGGALFGACTGLLMRAIKRTLVGQFAEPTLSEESPMRDPELDEP